MRALAAGALGAGVLACALDWAVRPDPAPGVEAGSDAASDEGPAPPSNGRDASSPSPDAAADDATDCTRLRADVDTKLGAARVCTLTVGECQVVVKNECGCDVVVTQLDAPATAAYQSAVGILKAHPECLPTCVACPSTGSRACLVRGTKTECFPP